MLETARCPLAETADLLVYDPWMNCDEGETDATELVRALRARYPAIPVLLVTSKRGIPAGLRARALGDPQLRLLCHPDRQGLARAVTSLTAGSGC
jgi:hypothetical protein